jgi:hypothetical protein
VTKPAEGQMLARGETTAGYDGRRILAGGVAPRSNTPDILGRGGLPAGRLARLGATREFHHGLLDRRTVCRAFWLAIPAVSILASGTALRADDFTFGTVTEHPGFVLNADDLGHIIKPALDRLAGTIAAEPATWTFAAAAATDWATTAHALGWHGGHENNPVISWAPNVPITIAVGAAIDTGGVLLWRRVTRNHPKLRAAGLYAGASARVFVAARNEYRIAHPGVCAPVPPCSWNCIEAFSRCR